MIAFLDVGHGNCFAMVDDQRAVLIDVPPGRVPTEFLRENGVAVITDVVISHFDKDHSGGFTKLQASGFTVQNLWFSDDQTNRTVHFKTTANALAAARRRGARVARGHVDVGASFQRGQYRFEFLHPPYEDVMTEGSSRNERSAIVRVAKNEHGIALLPADVTFEACLELIDSGVNCQADWLVVPHHGGEAGAKRTDAPALLRALLQKTEAKHVFFSYRRSVDEGDGSRQKVVRPRPDLVELIRDEFPSLNIYCAQLSGHCCKRPAPWSDMKTFHATASEGTMRKVKTSCAGSIVIDQEDDRTSWRWHNAHQYLLDGLERRPPLCRSPLSRTPEISSE